jgi:selenocysteine-specific elongation factor
VRPTVLGTAGHIDDGKTALVRALTGRLTAFPCERGQITPAEYKTVAGASRKYTVPLMEHFGEHKRTIRVGNVRRRRQPE